MRVRRRDCGGFTFWFTSLLFSLHCSLRPPARNPFYVQGRPFNSPHVPVSLCLYLESHVAVESFKRNLTLRACATEQKLLSPQLHWDGGWVKKKKTTCMATHDGPFIRNSILCGSKNIFKARRRLVLFNIGIYLGPPIANLILAPLPQRVHLSNFQQDEDLRERWPIFTRLWMDEEVEGGWVGGGSERPRERVCYNRQAAWGSPLNAVRGTDSTRSHGGPQ